MDFQGKAIDYPGFLSKELFKKKFVDNMKRYIQYAQRIISKFSTAAAFRLDQRYQQYGNRGQYGNQIKEEIDRLLLALKDLRPKNILEIGTSRGRLLFRFAELATPGATMVGIDIKFPDGKDTIYAHIPAGHNVILLEADSHASSTVKQVENFFPSSIDFLFIDGDHSYEGVKLDFLCYFRLVRPGGMIVFHDIVNDFRTRYGVATYSNVGGVPKFWQEIKKDYEYTELINNSQQDGFGMGIIYIKGEQKINK